MLPSTARLKEIVQGRLKFDDGFTAQMLDNAIAHFKEIRTLALKKKPATAELLGWLRILDKMQLDANLLKPGRAEALAFTYSALAKNKEDKETLCRTFVKGQ